MLVNITKRQFFHVFNKKLIMVPLLINKIKDIFLNPVEAFRQSREDQPRFVLSYLIIILLIMALSSLLIFPLTSLLFVLMVTVLAGFFGVIIIGAWTHIFVYLFGGRNGIMQTIKVVVYSATPYLLFGGIPYISIIFAIWSAGLAVLGIRDLQELTIKKAISVVIIGIIIPMIIIVMLALWMMSVWTSMIENSMLVH